MDDSLVVDPGSWNLGLYFRRTECLVIDKACSGTAWRSPNTQVTIAITSPVKPRELKQLLAQWAPLESTFRSGQLWCSIQVHADQRSGED